MQTAITATSCEQRSGLYAQILEIKVSWTKPHSISSIVATRLGALCERQGTKRTHPFHKLIRPLVKHSSTQPHHPTQAPWHHKCGSPISAHKGHPDTQTHIDRRMQTHRDTHTHRHRHRHRRTPIRDDKFYGAAFVVGPRHSNTLTHRHTDRHKQAHRHT